MIHEIVDLPANQRQRLMDDLAAGLLAPPYSAAAVRATLGSREHESKVLDVLEEWESMGVSGYAAAEWIRSLEEVASRTVPPSLVWTGPATTGLYSRDTRAVYSEMVANAKRSIIISSYAYFDGPEAFKELATKMDEMPSVSVTLLLNIERRRWTTTATDALVRGFAERFWGSDWPGEALPDVYYDPRSVDTSGPKGVLHAKAVVTDEETLFVTSANLTEAAFDRNVEMGVLSRDRAIAKTAAVYFRGLIDRGLLHPLPRP